jgi:hypothetical protein
MSIEVTKETSEVRYVLSFGDSQKPERYRFTESEIKKLFKDLQKLLYPAKEMP